MRPDKKNKRCTDAAMHAWPGTHDLAVAGIAAALAGQRAMPG